MFFNFSVVFREFLNSLPSLQFPVIVGCKRKQKRKKLHHSFLSVFAALCPLICVRILVIMEAQKHLFSRITVLCIIIIMITAMPGTQTHAKFRSENASFSLCNIRLLFFSSRVACLLRNKNKSVTCSSSLNYKKRFSTDFLNLTFDYNSCRSYFILLLVCLLSPQM